MSKCGECKYFGEEFCITDDDTFEKVPTGYHKCDLIKMLDTWQYLRDIESGIGAITQDGSGYYAALLVEEDFGCVKFEVKESKE